METAPEPETKETQNTAENAPLVSDEPQSSSRDVQRPSDEPGASHSQTSSKPNKVYIGGLPDDTREADLRGCFGNFGAIKSIELKTGYGFVEFDSRAAAEKAVAVYHEGSFLGNIIRVELSHGGSKVSFKSLAEPGACFKCGQHGHWARECPNHVVAIQRKGWVDRTGTHGSLHSRSGSFRDGQSASLPPRTSRDDDRAGGRRQGDYGSNNRHAIREPRRPDSPYYEYNRPTQPAPHTYDDRRYATGPARPAYPLERPPSPYGVPPRTTSNQIGPRDYGRGYERPSAPYEPRPVPHHVGSYTYNGSFARRLDPYHAPPQNAHAGLPYAGYLPAARDAPGRRSPQPRVGGRYQDYNSQGGYDRPYERRRSASPYRAAGPHPAGIHPSGNGYSRVNTGSYGRPQSYLAGSGYSDHGPSGPRGQAPHMAPIANPNSTNRIGERDYRQYRG